MLTKIMIAFNEGQIYFTIYACLAAAMIVELFYENEIVSRWLARAGMLGVILFIGLRWDTGTDWNSYYRIFYTSDTSSDYDSVVFGIDYGYIALNRIVFLFSQNYTTFLIIDALIAIIPVYIFIERSTKLPCMGVFLFYCSYALTHFMGSNRRMIAIGFVCIGFLALTREHRLGRNWPKWAVPFAVAAVFHRTSVGALPGLFVGDKAWRTRTTLLVLGLSVALGTSGLSFTLLESLADALSQYTGISAVQKLIFYTSGDAQFDLNVNLTQQAMLGAAKRSTVLVILITYMRFGRPSIYAQRLYNVYIMGCALYFAMISAPIFQIISTYFSIVEIALIPIVFNDIKSFKVPYTMYLLGIPLLLLISSLLPYLDLYVPYRSIYTY